jgi:hypothetical protein
MRKTLLIAGSLISLLLAIIIVRTVFTGTMILTVDALDPGTISIDGHPYRNQLQLKKKLFIGSHHARFEQSSYYPAQATVHISLWSTAHQKITPKLTPEGAKDQAIRQAATSLIDLLYTYDNPIDPTYTQSIRNNSTSAFISTYFSDSYLKARGYDVSMGIHSRVASPRTTLISLSDSSAKVRVNFVLLNFSGSATDSFSKEVTVSLVKSNGQWKLNKVEG